MDPRRSRGSSTPEGERAPGIEPARDRSRANWTGALWYWGPLVLWLGAILFFSGDTMSAAHTSGFIEPAIRRVLPGASREIVYALHVAVRKSGHVAEYALVGLLAWRALRGGRRAVWRWDWAIGAFAIGVLFAFVDEFRQSFAGTRTGSLGDVAIDAAGCACGLLVLAWAMLRRERAAQG